MIKLSKQVTWMAREEAREGTSKRFNSFGSFVSAVGWSALLLLNGRLDRQLDCRPSHRRSGIDGRRGRCRLFRVILVERAN